MTFVDECLKQDLEKLLEYVGKVYVWDLAGALLLILLCIVCVFV